MRRLVVRIGDLNQRKRVTVMTRTRIDPGYRETVNLQYVAFGDSSSSAVHEVRKILHYGDLIAHLKI